MEKSKKICFLINSLKTGGAERTVAYLTDFISKYGYDVDLVLYGDLGCYDLNPQVNVIYLNKSDSSSNVFKRLATLVKRYFLFKKYMKKEKPQIIFCMLYPAIIYTLFSKKIVISSERSNPAYLKGMQKIIRDFLFKHTDGIVFQTERAKNFFCKKIREKGIVIPNAVGNLEAYNIEYKGERRKAIVAIGSLKKEKDYFTLIKSFKIVCSKYPEYQLEIYGDGNLKNQLMELVDLLNIQKNVHFMGIKKDVLSLVKDASCYVLSSESEGMPNALMEALAIGLPCVSTDCPNGPSELIKNGVNGLLVPVADVDSLANAILKLIEDYDLASKCSQNGRKILMTNNVNSISLKYLEFIEKYLNN